MGVFFDRFRSSVLPSVVLRFNYSATVIHFKKFVLFAGSALCVLHHHIHWSLILPLKYLILIFKLANGTG